MNNYSFDIAKITKNCIFKKNILEMEYLIKFFSYWVLFTIIYFSFMLIWGWFTTFFYFVTDSSYLTMWSYCDYGFDCLYETMFRDGIRYSFFVSLVVAIF